jgi:SAM-dependent methyltransferase
MGMTRLPKRLIRSGSRRFARLAHWFQWRAARRLLGGTQEAAPNGSTSDAVYLALQRQEERLRALLSECAPGRFLEIGIGPGPNIERLRFMRDVGMSYTGCDFIAVCDSHAKVIERQLGSVPNLRLLGNTRGTYAWTLMELMRDGERFDIIYLDGHHTFYIDLPAFILADFLLSAGGTFCVDDLSWTLDFLSGDMAQRFDEWLFYHDVYDFSQYTDAQRAMPHIDLIVGEIMVKKLGYEILEHDREADWAVLRKPPARLT